jgi:intracellular septation protein
MSEPTETPAPRAVNTNQLLIDLGPTLLFVIAYNVLLRVPAARENAVYLATGLFIAATLAAMSYSLWKLGRIPPVLIVTGVIVTAFGGLTIALHDETFVKLKPTVANFFYAVALAGSVLARQNVWKLLFGHIFTLPERIWTVLALRWAGFFFCMGLLNEALRRTMSTSDWVTWHFPILYIPLLLFAVANTPLILKHHREDAEEPAQAAPGA